MSDELLPTPPPGELQPVDEVPNANSLLNAKILGIDSTGATKLFKVSDIKGDYKGIATGATNPGVPLLAQNYKAKPGTYPYFLDSGGEPIVIPDDVDGKKVLLAYLSFDGITPGWSAYYTPVEIDLVEYTKFLDIVNDLITGGINKILSAEQGRILAEQVEGYNQSESGALEFTDEQGNLALRIFSDGTIEYFKVTAETKDVIINAIGGERTEDGAFSIEDEAGNVIFRISELGVVTFPLNDNLDTIIKGILDERGLHDSNNDYLSNFTDINHIITYGQSLSVGQSEIVISEESTFPDNLLCFDGIVRTSDYDKSLTDDVYPVNRRIAFAPLVERVNDDRYAGLLRETPTTGTVEMLATQLNKYAFKKFPDLQLKIIGSAPGEGATIIAQLSKGGPYYDRLIQDVQAGFDLSQAENKHYKVLAVTWTQGESDYMSGTGAVEYKYYLTTLRDDLNTDIKAITGQQEDVAIVTYQTATSFGGGVSFPNIALAQLDCALTEGGIYMANAMYQLNYTDTFHLTAASSKLLGCYYGYAINQIITLSKDFKPIHVLSTMRQGNILKVKFHVPVLPLQFSSANGVMLANKGFKVMKSGVDILLNIQLGCVGDSVNLLCSEDPSGGVIQYGINNTVVPHSNVNLGNLKDSQGNKEKTLINDAEYGLDNWCPIFEHII